MVGFSASRPRSEFEYECEGSSIFDKKMTTRILSNNKHNRFHLHYLFDVVKLFLDSFIFDKKMTTRILSNNKHNRFHLHYLFDVVKLFLDSFISINFRSIAASSLSRTLPGFVASSSYSLPTGRFVSFEFKNFSSKRRKKKMVGATNQLV